MFRLLFRCIISFLYIKPQPFTSFSKNKPSCIISFLYIKPQLLILALLLSVRCIISFLYIKPQLSAGIGFVVRCCIISFLYIKPQLLPYFLFSGRVVLYRFSTSNHNVSSLLLPAALLYYIVSLHQTTTWDNLSCSRNWLYYIVSLHQTTTYTTYILSNQLLDSPTG